MISASAGSHFQLLGLSGHHTAWSTNQKPQRQKDKAGDDSFKTV